MNRFLISKLKKKLLNSRHFREVYPPQHVTPFIHIFKNHLYQFKQIHGSIQNKNLQGLEAKNKTLRQAFDHQCNKNRKKRGIYVNEEHEAGKEFMVQLFNRENRLDFLRFFDKKHIKNYYEED